MQVKIKRIWYVHSRQTEEMISHLSHDIDNRDPVMDANILPRNIHTINLSYIGPFTLP